MTQAKQRLLEISPGAPDSEIVTLIAYALLESDRQPYCFSINHDIRPPKNLACPVDYDWALKGRVGIHTSNRLQASIWIVKAALAGYSVCLTHPKTRACEGCSYDIATARTRAKFHQRPNKEDDDDIPF